MNQWFLYRNNKPVGPYTLDQMRSFLATGRVHPNELVWGGGGDWAQAGTIPLLSTPSAPQSQAGFGDTLAEPGFTRDREPAGMSPVPEQVQPAGGVAVARGKGSPVQTQTPSPDRASRSTSSASKSSPLHGLRKLPKPVLLGVCGGLGGFLAALLVGELLWLLLSPPRADNRPPPLRLAAPAEIRIYPGKKNKVTVKIAREGFAGPVNLELQGEVDGLTLTPRVIPADKDTIEIDLQADANARVLDRALALVGTGPEEVPGAVTRQDMVVKVEQPPPRLKLSVPSRVVLHQKAKSKFTVRLGRYRFRAPVQLQQEQGPGELKIPSQVIPTNEDKVEIVLTATEEFPVGTHTVALHATAPTEDPKPSARATFELEVKPVHIPKVDVLFVLDLTGSMDFAIQGIQAGIQDFANQLSKARLDARVGIIVFKDLKDDGKDGEPTPLRFGDEVFTRDYAAFGAAVGKLKAKGGGDDPESSLQGLGTAANQGFRPNTTRVLLLITDAPPKIHPGHPPVKVPDAVSLLKSKKIDQLHLIARVKHLNGQYSPFKDAFEGTQTDIKKVDKRSTFAALLPKLSKDIARITIANLPPPPSEDAPLPPPAETADEIPPPVEEPTLPAVQSTQSFRKKDRWRLLLAISVWTGVVAAGISLLLCAGQELYLRQRWLPVVSMFNVIMGGLVAGLIGGAVGQLFFESMGSASIWMILGRFLGWTLLGGLIGVGLAFFVPNLKWHRGLLGGSLGGALGAAVFLGVGTALGAVLGRWVGAGVLGACIGLMVALAELAFRRCWLEVSYGARETRTVTLGDAPITVGSDEQQVSIFVRDAPAVALRYRLDRERVLCENLTTGISTELQPGAQQQLAGVTLKVCSPASASTIGYRLHLATGSRLPLADGMPLTTGDLPGLESQQADGTVALVARRPSDRARLLLRNRSRQSWKVQEPDGTTRQVDPGGALELAPNLRIQFGTLEAKLVQDRSAAREDNSRR